jgi:hypothetical protein
MRGLVADYKKELKREKVATVVLKVCQFAPVAAPVGIAMTGGGGGLIASIGFGAWMASEAVTRWRAKNEEEKKKSPVPAAFVFDTQRHLRTRRPWRGRWF